MSTSTPPSPSYPPLLHKSHDDGSSAALQLFFMSLCMWEILYHVARYLLKVVLKRYPTLILSPSLTKDATKKQSNGHSNGNGTTQSPSDIAKHTILQRGPSYIVSLLHSTYATGRGIMHICNFIHASSIDKVFIPDKEILNSYRWAHLHVVRTNTIFLSYLCYDLIHIILQYPNLGGIDTLIHHLIFASCSVINGTFGVLANAFGWLIVGEGSTIFLNLRWFLLKSGRETGPALDKINGLFAFTFFLTRIGIYSVGIIDLFHYSLPELKSLPAVSGVPVPLLGLTCGCVLLGWVLNILWGYKILGMVRGKVDKKKQQ